MSGVWEIAELWNIDRRDVDQIERWEDLSAPGVAGRIDRLTEFAIRADGLDRLGLGERELTMLGALSFGARSSAVGLPYERDLSLVAGAFNFATFLSVLVPGYALVTRRHAQGYVDKLRSMRRGRSRPLHRRSGPSHELHDRPSQDRATPSPRQRQPRPAVFASAIPRHFPRAGHDAT
jgi:hypothetical protein